MCRTLDQLPKGWGDRYHVIVPLAELKEYGERRRDIYDITPALRGVFIGLGFYPAKLEHPVGGDYLGTRYVQGLSFINQGYPRIHLKPELLTVVSIEDVLFLLLGLSSHKDYAPHRTDYSGEYEAREMLERVRVWFEERFLEGGPCLLSNAEFRK